MVSITILSFDRKSDLKACIDSLYRHTDIKSVPFEVIIVDQNSNKETTDYLKKLRFANLKIIFLKRNIGCSAGRKAALKECSPQAEFIFQADNDIVFTPRWLEKMLKNINTRKGIGALQASCITLDNHTLLSGGVIERYSLTGIKRNNGYIAYFCDIGSDKHKKSFAFPVFYCDYVSGGATLFRKKLFETVSYDEKYLNGYEDYDLSLCARKNGWKLACDFTVKLIHQNRRFKNSTFWKKEKRYINTRENSRTLYFSLCNFVKKHGLNPVRSDGFDKIIKDPSGKPFSYYSDYELKAYFDKL